LKFLPYNIFGFEYSSTYVILLFSAMQAKWGIISKPGDKNDPEE